MVAPGETLSDATLLIEEGKVRAVGQVEIPAGARVIDASGKVIHAGFLDPYVTEGRVSESVAQLSDKPQLAERVREHLRVADTFRPKQEALDQLRELGFVGIVVVPEKGIARGQAALYHTGRAPDRLWQADLASVFAFEALGWEKLDGENYPLSLMGNVAFLRGLFADSAWYERHRDDGTPIAMEQTLDSLQAVRKGQRLLLSEASSPLDVLRQQRLWSELGIPRQAVVMSGREWQTLDWLDSGRAHILPLAYPSSPKMGPGLSEHDLTLAALRDWHAAPGTAGWLARKRVPFALTTHRLKSLDEWPVNLQEALAAGLSEQAALAALTTEPARLLGLSATLGALRPGMSASFVIREGTPFSGESQVKEVWIEGRRHPRYSSLVQTEKPAEPVKPRDFIRPGDYLQPPAFLPRQPFAPPAVLVKGATLWTGEPGAEPRVADLLVRGGKVVAVGSDLSAGGAHQVDGTGLHVTPGLVDAHSHSAVEGDVNEPGAAVTAMVRIKDVVNPFDHDIYLQLASGVTTVNILHGSANAIGGQSLVAKWRLGSRPEGLVMVEAPEGIKFALGENPKQSNWGDHHASRYPQSRLGVNELIHGAFESAKNYRRQQQAGLDPRPDQALEALAEVLEGRRQIHCHSYRQDEILALIRLAEQEGFKVSCFQHVLEGYKVADEIARHGATASTFADWWAYKVEVEDAIPHNAALMSERGVVASVNSDSPDLARRLNTEAGKSVRYGGMSEVEALALVTRNPALQLGIADKVGTLAPGKDADFVIWSAHPLSQQAVCLETWIEGRRYYRQADEARRVQELQAERERLLGLAVSQQKEDKK
jgi:imidazolonepropionase-like amidohydrolase